MPTYYGSSIQLKNGFVWTRFGFIWTEAIPVYYQPSTYNPTMRTQCENLENPIESRDEIKQQWSKGHKPNPNFGDYVREELSRKLLRTLTEQTCRNLLIIPSGTTSNSAMTKTMSTPTSTASLGFAWSIDREWNEKITKTRTRSESKARYVYFSLVIITGLEELVLNRSGYICHSFNRIHQC